MIITLATSLDDISISVRGISNKLRTHNRDFTCRRSKLENAQGGKMFSTLKRVNYYYYYYYYYYKVNRCLARYSPRATTTNRPTNRALNKPAWPGQN